MDIKKLQQAAQDFMLHSPGNCVPKEKAMREEFAGVKMFDSPIMGVASADDEYLLSLPGIPEANIDFAPPKFWFESAASVISIYFPLAEQIRESNRQQEGGPSELWVHARNEGRAFMGKLCEHLKELLEKAGHQAIIPGFDPRFYMAVNKPVNGRTFTSNWSERHVAYAAGIGTFSLHRAIITQAGAAGCLGSIVTSLKLPPTSRGYNGLEDYCTHCGACAENCPAGAISLDGKMTHLLCREFLMAVAQQYAERGYISGCGKCMTGVPCESSMPICL